MAVSDPRIYRRYRKEFENEFGWVRQNPDGSETAFCQVCEISITPTSSCLITHEASARHQKNVYDVKKTGQKTPGKPREDGPRSSIWKKDYDKTRRFRDEWLEKFPWVQRDPDGDRFGFCPHCNIKLEPKAKRLEDHERTTKHLKNSGTKLSSLKRLSGRRFRGRRKKFRRVKKEKPVVLAATEGEEESLANQFEKISDISELMDELPALLDEEGDVSAKMESTSAEMAKQMQLQRKRQNPDDIKQEGDESAQDSGDVEDLHDLEDVAGSSKTEVQMIGEGISNPWSSQFPWVVMTADEGSFPFCKYCETFVEPLQMRLEQHQESEKHLENEKNKNIVRIVFNDPNDPNEPTEIRHAARTPKSKSAKAVVERVRNPPTKRVLALQESKKNLLLPKIEPGLEQDEQQHQHQLQLQQQQVNEQHCDDDVTGMSAVQIIQSTPMQINLVLPVSDDNPNTDQVNITDYVNILIDGSQDEEMIEVSTDFQPSQQQNDQIDDVDQDDDDDDEEDESKEIIVVAGSRRRRYNRREPYEPKASAWRKEYEKTRRFQPEWLTEHPWVRQEVRAAGIVAYCPYCNIDLDPRVVRLRQHEKTSKHRRNEEVHSKRVMEEESGLIKKVKTEPEERKPKMSPVKVEVRPRYKCDLCNLRFVAQRNLYLHLKEHYEPSSKEPQESQEVALDELEPERPPEVKYEYKPAWERIFPWLQKAVDDDWAFCSLCKFPMEPKLSVIKAHLKHRRHVKLVSQQDNPTRFEPKPDTAGVLAEDDKIEKKKRNSIVGNADIITDVDGRQKYQCKVCKKVLVKTSFAVHLRIHQGLRPFQCTMCEWAFKQAYDLKHHVESIHNNIKAHQCELCGKEFTRKYTLRLHLKSHTDARDYKCDTCQRGFFTRGKLIEHERTHTGEKPFLCDFCGRGFRIKYDMVQHRLKTHYGVQPKRRRPQNKIVTAVSATPTTTTYQIKDGEMIDEQGNVMTVDESVEVEMEDHTVHTVHTIDGGYEQKHQLVFISETEAVFLTK